MSEHDRTAELMRGPSTFVRVYRLPEKLTDGFCFGGGRPITFLNVDWFECPLAFTPEQLREEVMRKKYFDKAERFLILADHDGYTFTINPTA